MVLYERVASLPLQIDRYDLEGLSMDVSSDFTRDSTVVHLFGGEHQGVGEDVTYHGLDHIAFRDSKERLPITGSFTLRTFSDLLDEIDLFPVEPEWSHSRHFRRWAFESAALDLALRQDNLPLFKVLEIEPAPVEFVISKRLGDPASIETIEDVLRMYPESRFKLDPTHSWNEKLVSKLASTGAVVTIDLKGAYKGTIVDQDANPELYKLVLGAFPKAWVEDPEINEETEPILSQIHDRITWDAPIHSVSDIEDLSFPPRMLNIKPSRFGTIEKLLDAYDYCAEQGIDVYGGGQFELGPGRGQIQYLASLFHAESPNDVAPAGYNEPSPGSELETSPLDQAPSAIGFRWG